MRLIVIRHGETPNNVEDRFTGQLDVPLSLVGEQQIEMLASYLAAESFDALVSSDLQRARRTALAVARYHQLAVEEDARLRELSLGEWEGLTVAEVQAYDAVRLKDWRTDPSCFAPEGGETLIQFRTRIVSALDHWSARYPYGTVVWVAHAGLIGVLLCHVLEIDLNRRWQFHHANASVTEVRFEQGGTSLVRLNETAFLRDIRRRDEVLSTTQLT